MVPMTTTILGLGGAQLTLDHLTRSFLEEQDPTSPAIYEVNRVSYQILFSNNILEYDELIKAVLTFDAEWARTHRKYEPLGIHIFDSVPDMFYSAHPEATRPTNIAGKREDATDLSSEFYEVLNMPESCGAWFIER